MKIVGIVLIIGVLFVAAVIARNRKAEAERKERLKHVFDHYEGAAAPKTKAKRMRDMTPEEAYQKGKELSGYEENISFPTLKNKRALPYIEYAAENGHAEAQHVLSECYYSGKLGLEVDDKKCLYWEEKAAEQGHVVAQAACGSTYELGIGCAVNLEKAIYWYERCLATMDSDPREYIESGKYDDVLKYTTIKRNVSRLKSQVEKPLSRPTSKPAAPKTAPKPEPKPVPIKTTPKSTAAPSLTRENISAEQATLLQYALEDYRNKHYSQALMYFVHLGENGHLDSQTQMYIAEMTARMYYYGEGCEVNYEKALYWYEKAAEQGNENAQLWVGKLYEQGQGCTKDTKKARYWYEKAAAQGNSDAQKLLNGMNAVKSEVAATVQIPTSPYMSVVRVFKGSLGETMIVATVMKGEISVKDRFKNDRTGKVYKADMFRFINSIQNFDENANDPDSYVDCVNAETAGHRMFVFFILDFCDIEAGDWLVKCE